MQFPNAKSDLLMFAPSRIRIPLFLVAVARSDPARSISIILATLTLALFQIIYPTEKALCKQSGRIFELI